jgi:hypothetical protein
VLAGDTVVCYFVFPAHRNQLVESFVYYCGDADIQSNYNPCTVIPYYQQDGSEQSPQIGVTNILPADTDNIGFFCKHGYIVYVQRPGNHSVVFDNIHQCNALRIVVHHRAQAYFFAHGRLSYARKCGVFVFHSRRRRNANTDKYRNPHRPYNHYPDIKRVSYQSQQT